MTLKRILTADATLSLVLHSLKALTAFLVSWMVLHGFGVGDFVTWSVTSSVLVIATASDLGIGQYVVTHLIASHPDDWAGHIRAGLGALMPLALGAAVFVCLAIKDGGAPYVGAMAAFLSIRVLTIPFAAVLNAVNQFKIRKAIELAGYLLATGLIAAIIWQRGTVRDALFALNLTFVVSALATVLCTARLVPIGAALRPASLGQSLRVFRAAVPFMANNLTGLLTYGGFVWLCSLVLPQGEVAKLAVLHGFILSNLYQVYDVFLKSRQADLAHAARLAPYARLNLALMMIFPLVFVLLGRVALGFISGALTFSLAETALFGMFIALELGNLFVQSVAQVSIGSVNRLKPYAVIRALLLTAFLLTGLLPVAMGMRLYVLLAGLLVGSGGAYLYLRRALNDDARRLAAVTA